MNNPENCVFCYPDEDLDSRVIHYGDDFYSFVSKPFFRPGHILVAPAEHYEHMNQVPDDIKGRMMGEIALLASWIDRGYGAITIQKYQPTQEENGIKMNHSHIHAWPRTWRDEKNGILIPAPQHFNDFFIPRTSAEKEYERHTISTNHQRLKEMHRRFSEESS